MAVVAALFGVLWAGVARADDPVLHEYVPDARDGELSSLVSGRDSGASAIVYRGEVLPPPDTSSSGVGLKSSSRIAGDGDVVADGTPGFRPDRVTALEGTLGYSNVFTPSIAPFKRITALDRVALADDGSTPVLRIASSQTRRVIVHGADAPSPNDTPRERFWGRVDLDFTEGRRVPFPSVSPNARILTIRTDPRVTLRLEKDGADNYFAVLEGKRPEGEVRVVFLTDAPQPYFNATIPEAPSDALGDSVPALPSKVRRQARRFASELGVARGDPLSEVLRTLTRHFRSFEESSEPPERTGSIYLDLARAQKGVCRHRVYAFVITAQALGIPARFVYNEAHSWAEVRMPTVGWMRVDLGGAAEALETRGDEDGPRFRPAQADPLPQPEAYRRSYSRLGANSGGRAAGSGGDGGTDATGAGSTARTESPDANRIGRENEARAVRPESSRQDARDRPQLDDSSAPAVSRPEDADEDESPSREPLTLTVTKQSYEVLRGARLRIRGRAVDPQGHGVDGLRVEVLLQEGRERLLGVTVTDENGWFHDRFAVPPELEVGDYRLVVRTPGDDKHASAVAR